MTTELEVKALTKLVRVTRSSKHLQIFITQINSNLQNL